MTAESVYAVQVVGRDDGGQRVVDLTTHAIAIGADF
jgi:hypothetical protein